MANPDDAEVELPRTGAGLPRRPSRSASQRASLQIAPLRARRDSKRDALLQSAREQFASNGFLGTHVAVVAARAGIRKSTFFHYYDDKEALYDAAVAAPLDEIALAVDDVVASNPRFARSLDTVVEVVHARLAAEASLPRLLMRGLVDAPPPGAHHPTAVERIRARIVDVLRVGVRDGALPPLDPLGASNSASALLAVIALFCLHDDARADDDAMARTRVAELQERARRLLGAR